eukprot:876575-Pelagomonas_calceolata.AAC.1
MEPQESLVPGGVVLTEPQESPVPGVVQRNGPGEAGSPQTQEPEAHFRQFLRGSCNDPKARTQAPEPHYFAHPAVDTYDAAVGCKGPTILA